jgi:hypothetical protein
VGKAHHVLHPQLAGEFCRAVSAAVIYDQDFNLIYTGDGAGQGGQRFWQRLGFVEARDLDNQLHQ